MGWGRTLFVGVMLAPVLVGVAGPARTYEVEDHGDNAADSVDVFVVTTAQTAVDLRVSPDGTFHYQLLGLLTWQGAGAPPVTLSKVAAARHGKELSLSVESGVVPPYSMSATLVVKIPSSFRGEVRMTSHTGDLRMSGLNVRRVSGQLAAGDAVLDSLTADVVEIVAQAGDIRLLRSRVETFKAATRAGEVRAEGVEAKSAVVETTSGDAYMVDWRGTLECRTSSGEITAALRDDASGPVSITSASGNVKLTIPQAMGFALKAASVSGGIDSDLPLVLAGLKKNQASLMNGDGRVTLSVLTQSGDITFKRGR